MTRYMRHDPGQDAIAKWKAALAASKRQQRQRRGKRRRGIAAVTGPGMVRITAAADLLCPMCGNAHTNDVCGSDGCICEAIGQP